MNDKAFIAVLAKYVCKYIDLPGFNRHAFYSNSPETLNEFGDAVYFVDTEWKKNADRIIYGS